MSGSGDALFAAAAPLATALGLVVALGTAQPAMAACHVGGGGNDIDGIAASYDAGNEPIEVRMELCAAPDETVMYRLYLDWCGPDELGTPCDAIGPDTGTSGFCADTSDAGGYGGLPFEIVDSFLPTDQVSTKPGQAQFC